VVGASAYSRDIDFKSFRRIADQVGAFLMADIAHPAGLIASKLLNDPLPHCHIVTSTTHKTLRGPRGGLILIGKDYENPFGQTAAKSGRTKMMSEIVDSNLMPGIQGGPLMHVIAAKAVAFGEALDESFKVYSKQIVANAKKLASELIKKGYQIVSGGTDNHLILVDLRNKNVSGKDADKALEQSGITVNKNMVPFDDKSPLVTSGIRIGTPAVTTRGFKENEMTVVADFIDKVITNIGSEKVRGEVRDDAVELCRKFPLYDFGEEILSAKIQVNHM
jgi:glycine hydroxymethyltransferase